MKTNATRAQLERALDEVNVRFGGNIIFKRIEPQGKRMAFTLRVKDSAGAGAKLAISSFKTRRSVAACWHVHGWFFVALFDQSEELWVDAGRVGRMNGYKDNWQDFNIGSAARPVLFSESCNCKGEIYLSPWKK
jgi:hypothetical protein